MQFSPSDRTPGSASRTASLTLLIALLVTVALLGGSSRSDAVQIVALRPLAGLFFAIAIYCLPGEQIRKAKPLVVLFALLAIWMAAQLVPLPPVLWQSLPGRELIAELDQLAGLEGVWRPLSMTPSRGLNSLMSLIVPASALLLALSTNASSRLLLKLIAGLGAFDAVWGLFQAIAGPSSPLYIYSMTNRGSAVGIFANENHSAVFSAIALLAVAHLGVTSARAKDLQWLRIAYMPAFFVILLALLVSGSRAGIAVGFLALVASALMFVVTMSQPKPGRRASKAQEWVSQHPRALLALFGGAFGLLVALFAALGRMPSVDAVLSKSAFEDLRWDILPILTEMISVHWLLGSGFGSFDKLFQIYEPTRLLRPHYVNQAHNDWAQIVIEGGLPAVAILLVLLGWVFRAVLRVLATKEHSIAKVLFWGPVFVIICASSIVDYPLRVPSFQVIGVWLLLALAFESANLDNTT